MDTKEANVIIEQYMYPKAVINSYRAESLLYNVSWNKLMKVVQKIVSQDLSSISINYGTGCTDSFAYCTIKWDIGDKKFITTGNINEDNQSLIMAVFNSVVQFIQWYNNEQ